MTDKQRKELLDAVATAISDWSCDYNVADTTFMLKINIEDGWTKAELL